MKNFRVVYYSPWRTSVYKDNSSDSGDTAGHLFINGTPFYLKSYFDQQQTGIDLDWYCPLLHFMTKEQMADLIEQNHITIMAMGVYVWNLEHCLDTAQYLKSRFGSDLTIVIGGPSNPAAHNSEWMLSNRYIDYGVFGQGENAFCNIVRARAGQIKLHELSTVNTIFVDGDRVVRTPFRDKDRKQTYSIWTGNEKMLKDLVDRYTVDHLILNYETSRGCPFECTFCDWSHGLSNKVTKFVYDYRQDIALFAKYGIDKIWLADANFGQWDSDLEILDMLYEQQHRVRFTIYGVNTSKTKKHNVEKIYDKMAAYGFSHIFKFSIQDSNHGVLDSIRRPDITWEEHRAMIRRLSSKYPLMSWEVECIMGLPGQSLETWTQTMRDIIGSNILPRVHLLEHIPLAPINLDRDYAEYWNLQRQPILYQRALVNNTNDPTKISAFEDYRFMDLVISSRLFSIDDWITMYVETFFKLYALSKYNFAEMFAIENFGNVFLDTCQELIEKSAAVAHMKRWLKSSFNGGTEKIIFCVEHNGMYYSVQNYMETVALPSREQFLTRMFARLERSSQRRVFDIQRNIKHTNIKHPYQVITI
jgi:hypothetical protein